MTKECTYENTEFCLYEVSIFVKKLYLSFESALLF